MTQELKAQGNGGIGKYMSCDVLFRNILETHTFGLNDSMVRLLLF